MVGTRHFTRGTVPRQWTNTTKTLNSCRGTPMFSPPCATTLNAGRGKSNETPHQAAQMANPGNDRSGSRAVLPRHRHEGLLLGGEADMIR